MHLQGEKIKLRAVRNSDLEKLYELMMNPDSWGDFEPFAAQDYFTFEKNMRERGTNPLSAVLLLIESTRDKSILGMIFHRESHPVLRNTEIGYAVFDSKSRGKGLASEATRLMVDYLFRNKTIERIEAVTDVENIASQKVLERSGFKKEGTMRKARWVNGVFHDYFMWGLLREDWSGRGQARTEHPS